MPPYRLALLLCMTVPLALWPRGSFAANSGSRAAVRSIEVTAEQVTIHLSAAAVYTQAALPKDPRHGRADRCYVDVAGVLGQGVQRVYAGDSQQVQQVRVGQFQPQTVRVVLDLLTAQPCRVQQAVNPDRLQIIVGRPPWPDNMNGAGFMPAEPPTQPLQQEPAPERQAHQVVQQEPAAELPASGALEYLDLRTPFSSGAQPAQAISIFDQQTPEGTPSQLSLLDQQPPEGGTSQSSLFSRQAIDERALQLAPSGLYLLQGEGQDAGSSAAPRLEW